VKEGAPGQETLWADVARNAIRDDAPDESAPSQELFSTTTIEEDVFQ
jgi:hypothetical protein